MKKKMLSMAAAITMAVVILTGCSAGFNRDFVIEAAKEYGMDDTRALYESAQISNVDVKAYYISDSKQADVMRHMFTHAGLDTEYDIKETILFSEVKANKSGDVTDVNKSSDSATKGNDKPKNRTGIGRIITWWKWVDKQFTSDEEL